MSNHQTLPCQTLGRDEYLASQHIDTDIATIKRGLKELNLSANRLAARINVSSTRVSQSLNKKYPGDIGQVIYKALNELVLIKNQDEAKAVNPFVETSLYKIIKYVCDEIFRYRHTDAIGLVTGHVGIGKSTCLEEYERRTPHAIYIRCYDGMLRKQILEELARKLGIMDLSSSKSIAALLSQVIGFLRESPKLIIFDECTRSTDGGIETLRDISDTAKCGLVYVGRERMYSKLSSNEGPFAEIASRILNHISPTKHLTEEDIKLIARASAIGDCSDECIDMIWDCSQANGRVLEHIIITLTSWVNKHGFESITPETICNIYKQFLKSKSAHFHDQRRA